MQQIILTQKDADWVANVIRDKLSLLKESYEEAFNNLDSNYNKCKELAETLFPGDTKIVGSLKDLEDYSNKIKKKKLFYTKEEKANTKEL